MILIGEAYRDAVTRKCPQLLDQAVVQFSRPLPLQESDNLLSSGWELGAVSPPRIDGIGERHLFRVACVPAILGQSHLLDGGLLSERREWGSRIHSSTPSSLRG